VRNSKGQQLKYKSLYSSLQGQRVYGGYSELVGSLFVSVKIDGLGNVLEQLTL
jgi:hypothetical protein